MEIEESEELKEEIKNFNETKLEIIYTPLNKLNMLKKETMISK